MKSLHPQEQQQYKLTTHLLLIFTRVHTGLRKKSSPFKFVTYFINFAFLYSQ